MPKPAQDRLQRGPLSALLILLGLLLGSGGAAATGSGIAAPAPRAAQGRQAPASALLQTALRNTIEDEASDGGAAPPILPSRPAIVTAALWSRGSTAPFFADTALPAQPTSLHYRARAPPAA